jgi:hypothetical protein
VSYRPAIHKPTTKIEPPNEEVLALFSSLSGPELRDALELVNHVSLNLSDSRSDSRAAMSNAFKIAMLEHECGSIDAAVLPGGKTSASQQLKPVFQDVSLQVDISLEGSDRGFVNKILNLDQADHDGVEASAGSILVKPKPSGPAGVHHVCQHCDELIGLLLANLDNWIAFRKSGIQIPYYGDIDTLIESTAKCRVCHVMRIWTNKYIEYKIVPGKKRATFIVESLHIPQATTYQLCQGHETKAPEGQSLDVYLEGRKVLVSPNSWKGISLLIGWLKQWESE